MNVLDATAQENSCELSLKMLNIGQDITFPLYVNPMDDFSSPLVEQFARDNNILYWGFHFIKSMAAYLYPQAEHGRLTILGQFMALDFYIDDLYGNLPTSQGVSESRPAPEVMRLLDACARVLVIGHSESSDHHAALALKEFCDSMIPRVNQAWWGRTAKNMLDHLNYSLMPTAYGWRTDGSVSIEDYIRLREISSGMYPTIDFIEFADAMFLPQEVMAHPQMVKLRQGCAKICCLTNDLFSYEKEVMARGLTLNLIRVVELNQQLPMYEAAILAIEIINREIAEFKEAAANFQFWDAQTNARVLNYIQGLKYQIAAVWFWGTRTNRYRSPRSPFIELRMML